MNRMDVFNCLVLLDLEPHQTSEGRSASEWAREKSDHFCHVRLAYKSYFFSQRTVFFSHNKSANNTVSRTGCLSLWRWSCCLRWLSWSHSDNKGLPICNDFCYISVDRFFY